MSESLAEFMRKHDAWWAEYLRWSRRRANLAIGAALTFALAMALVAFGAISTDLGLWACWAFAGFGAWYALTAWTMPKPPSDE